MNKLNGIINSILIAFGFKENKSCLKKEETDVDYLDLSNTISDTSYEVLGFDPSSKKYNKRYKLVNISNYGNIIYPQDFNLDEYDPDYCEIPYFLQELSKQINIDDTVCSVESPVWQVKYREYISCDPEGDVLHWVLEDSNGVFYRSVIFSDKEEQIAIDYLLDNYSDFCRHWFTWHKLNIRNSFIKINTNELKLFMHKHYNIFTGREELPAEVHKKYVQEIDKVVSTHLTESSAKSFIARRQSEYPELYIYMQAESSDNHSDIKELRAWIKSLTV